MSGGKPLQSFELGGESARVLKEKLSGTVKHWSCWTMHSETPGLNSSWTFMRM